MLWPDAIDLHDFYDTRLGQSKRTGVQKYANIHLLLDTHIFIWLMNGDRTNFHQIFRNASHVQILGLGESVNISSVNAHTRASSLSGDLEPDPGT